MEVHYTDFYNYRRTPTVSYTHLDVYKRQNYYRKFQGKYSELTAKFARQLSSKDKWTWGEEQDNALKLIKDKFLESVILHHPNFNKNNILLK